jgi:hypothetical protein
MPSDAKKQRDAAKKATTKNRGKARDKKQIAEEVEGCGTPIRDGSEERQNGVESGEGMENNHASTSKNFVFEIENYFKLKINFFCFIN